MASWLLPYNLFIALISIASSSVVPSPERDITDFKGTTSLDLSWPAPYAPPEPVKINTSLTPSEVALNGTLHLAAPRIHCDASTYGQGLNIASCREAWELLPISTARRTVGRRTEGSFDIPLPFRVLSHDGLCAIDIIYKRGLISDVSTGDELSRAASLVLGVCVQGPMQQGGVAVDIGERGGLAIRMVPWNPSNVQCIGIGPPSGSCRTLLDTMPASYNQQIFGPRDRETGHVDVELPQAFSEPFGRCVITGNTIGQLTSAAWYIFYLGAIGVDTMCVRRGLGGVITRLGGDGSLLVTIGDRDPKLDMAAFS